MPLPEEERYEGHADSLNKNVSWRELEYLMGEKLSGLFIGLDILTMILIVAGNGVVLGLVIRHKRLRTTTNYYIVSLCVADICVALVTVPLQILGHYSTANLTTFLCKVIEFVDYVALTANIFCVVAIAFDRHRAVVYPLQPKLSVKKCMITIAMSWTLSIVYGVRAAVVYDVTHRQHLINNQWQTFYKCEVPDENITTNKFFFILDFFVMYLLPLNIILLLYVKIWLSMHRGANKVLVIQAVRKRKRRVTKMLFMVVLVFGICQLPTHIIHLQVYWGSGPFHGYIVTTEAVDLLSFSNGWLNVIAYIVFNDKFSRLLFFCKRFHRVTPQSNRITTVDRSGS